MPRNIIEILKAHGVEFESPEKATAFEKDMVNDYKSVAVIEAAEAAKTKAEGERDTAIQDRDKYKAVADAFDGTTPEDFAKLKADFENLQKDAEAKSKAAQAAEEQSAFESAFDAALGDRKFANPHARAGVLAAVQKERETDQASGIADLIDKVTKDQIGIFENPQKPKANPLPGAEESGASKAEKPEGILSDEKIRSITGLPADYKLE